MARISLVIPPTFYHLERDISFKEILPHIGFAYIASYLRRQGHEIQLIDSVAENLRMSHLTDRVSEFKPEILGITASTYQIFEAEATVRAIKKLFPEIPTVLGGYHASAIPKRSLEEFTAFDYVCYGEGELSVEELIEKILTGEPVDKVLGIAYREPDGQVKVTAPRPKVRDLDSLPFPAFDLMPRHKYRGFYTTFSRRERPLTICTARGCPYDCNFCFKSTGSLFRKRSVPNVIEELLIDINEYKATQIVFTDEVFSMDKKRVHDMMDAIIAEGLHKKMKWICQDRVDRIDLDCLKKMKAANCQVVSYGIEAGNQEILKKIGKMFTLETAKKAIKWTKEAGIWADTNFIIGNTYDTRKTIMDTINFSIELDPDTTSFAILTPFPGTEIVDMAKNGLGGLKILSDDWSKFGKQVGEALELQDVPRADLERYHRMAYFRFYMRPRKILNALKVVNAIAVPIYLAHNAKTFIRTMFKKPSPAMTQ